MTKTYRSNTCLSVNVTMPGSGKGRHVSFNPLSSGASTFTTGDPDLQKALESHRGYGRLFRLAAANVAAVKEETKPAKAAKTPVEADNGNVKAGGTGEDEVAGTSTEAGQAESNLTVVKVADLAEAREYLADRFGVSRTSLRGTQKVLACAKRHGVAFEGLETKEAAR